MNTCPRFQYSLSQKLGRKSQFRFLPCPKNWDILVSHGVVVGAAGDTSQKTPNDNPTTKTTKPAVRRHNPKKESK